MSNSYFRFKQFTIFQDMCAMKVGTDGVLLGAWTRLAEGNNILDVGTGTGLIALMLAQRAKKDAFIDAIDIDEHAIVQAKENFTSSTFTNIRGIHNSLQEYVLLADKKYDIIVSNPPYFSSSLHSPVTQRNIARHDDNLNMKEFFVIAKSLLNENEGRISIVFSYLDRHKLIELAKSVDLFLSRETIIYTTPQSKPKRVLFEFSVSESIIEKSELLIEIERHVYSPDFVALLKDYYLKL